MFKRIDDIIETSETVLLFISTYGENQGNPLFCFFNPRTIITTNIYEEIDRKISEIDAWVQAGCWVAGFITYEAGYSFENFYFKKPDLSLPLLWFGVFDKPISIENRLIPTLNWLKNCADTYTYTLTDKVSGITEDQYITAVDKIKSYISQGDIYQANFTFHRYFSFTGSPFGLFCDLHNYQKVGYSAYISLPEHTLVSMSPELFFEIQDGAITVKPMKGTIKRGLWPEQDLLMRKKLLNSAKNRAENIMIVDLLRNDLGKFCKTGSITPSKIFEILRYETLFQMISTISAELPEEYRHSDIFKKMFPSGSVTGAPKIRAMEIIRELEAEPRGIYTGSIGYISPNGHSQFNVAIRTLQIDRNTGKTAMGIGSGIVADSNPKQEYEECLLKSYFLKNRPANFSLIETMLWENGSIFLEKYHLRRLSMSADHFGFQYDERNVITSLNELTSKFEESHRYKIRLLMDKYGVIKLEKIKLKVIPEFEERYIKLSHNKTCSDNIYLYHKTTLRDLYTAEHQSCRQHGFYDVIFMNEHGHITEGTISNLFIKNEDCYFTAPVESGLLNGTFRQFFIDSHPETVYEKIIKFDDLIHADAIYLTNAVAGMVEVKLIRQTAKHNAI